jgi:hypothetical protein
MNSPITSSLTLYIEFIHARLSFVSGHLSASSSSGSLGCDGADHDIVAKLLAWFLCKVVSNYVGN